MKKIIKTILIIILLCVFIYCIYNIISYLNNLRKNKKLANELKDTAIKEVSQNNDGENNEIKFKIPFEVDFDKLNEINTNIQAWLYMEDSIINYPIVKGNDNSYYLNHSIDGNYNSNGTLFMDYRNDENFENTITYIYGHHMKNNTMFGDLELFKEQSYYDNHKEMYLFTKNNNYKVELLAGFTTDDGSQIYNYIESSSNEEIVKLARNKSNFEANIDISNEDRLIALSTCSYDYKNARYVVLGVLRKI